MLIGRDYSWTEAELRRVSNSNVHAVLRHKYVHAQQYMASGRGNARIRKVPDLEHSPVRRGCLVLWPDSSGVLKLEKRYRAQMQKDPPKVHGGPTHPRASLARGGRDRRTRVRFHRQVAAKGKRAL